jgi:putative membrane protein
MGEIGGGNLPKVINDSFSPEETFVAHGCATHDFNLVSETEIEKVIRAMQKSRLDLTYKGMAAKSGRTTYGSVQVLYQKFGNSLLLVTSRSPERTEDLDFSIGMTIMAEGHRWFPHVAVVDAHNCMTDLSSPVILATHTAMEYQQASLCAMEESRSMQLYPFRIGVAHREVPFSREQGFGDLGIQVMVAEVDGQKTAYVLIDGNNVAAGTRETLLDQALTLVDHAEIMTTDSHVVNTITGKNPVGMAVSAHEIVPEMMQAIRDAVSDLSPSESAASTAQCENVIVFGSNRIVQLASTVNAMLVFVAPLSLAMLLLAFLLSIIAYGLMG